MFLIYQSSHAVQFLFNSGSSRVQTRTITPRRRSELPVFWISVNAVFIKMIFPDVSHPSSVIRPGTADFLQHMLYCSCWDQIGWLGRSRPLR